jgi:hypothetical protein
MMLVSRRVVPSSRSGHAPHVVTLVEGRVVACTCEGFVYRAACRHLSEVQAKPESYALWASPAVPEASPETDSPGPASTARQAKPEEK